MELDQKQLKRANGFYNVIKNFMNMKPELYVESGIQICDECHGTGLGGIWENGAGDPANRLRVIAACADAIAKWEPRLSLTKIETALDLNGELDIELTGQIITGESFNHSTVLGVKA